MPPSGIKRWSWSILNAARAADFDQGAIFCRFLVPGRNVHDWKVGASWVTSRAEEAEFSVLVFGAYFCAVNTYPARQQSFGTFDTACNSNSLLMRVSQELIEERLDFRILKFLYRMHVDVVLVFAAVVCFCVICWFPLGAYNFLLHSLQKWQAKPRQGKQWNGQKLQDVGEEQMNGVQDVPSIYCAEFFSSGLTF